jgi:hypothetical protein
MQQQQQDGSSGGSGRGGRQDAAAPAVIDVFGHGVSTVSALGSSSSSGSSSAAGAGSNGSSGSSSAAGAGSNGSSGSSSAAGAGSNGSSSVSSPSKAVLVAERLSKLWQQQQQRLGSVAGDSIPLPLLVAATVYPSVECYAVAKPYVSSEAGVE